MEKQNIEVTEGVKEVLYELLVDDYFVARTVWSGEEDPGPDSVLFSLLSYSVGPGESYESVHDFLQEHNNGHIELFRTEYIIQKQESIVFTGWQDVVQFTEDSEWAKLNDTLGHLFTAAEEKPKKTMKKKAVKKKPHPMKKGVNEVVKGNVRVSWVELGEGLGGEYNPDDTDDVELLRFDVHVLATEAQQDGQTWWEEVESYCTMVPASATEKERAKGLEIIMDAVYEPLQGNHKDIKHIAQALSWMDLKTIHGNGHVDHATYPPHLTV